MNRRGWIDIFLPLWSLICIIIIVMAFIIANTENDFDETTPIIGEKQMAILDVYSEAQAMQIYAQHAAQQAIVDASLSYEDAPLAQLAARNLNERMAQYPLAPPFMTFSAVESGGILTFTSTQTRIPIRIASAENAEQPVVGRAPLIGILPQWPLEGAVSGYEITSLFGKRNVDGGSPNHPGVDIGAVPGTEILAVGSGTVTTNSWDNAGTSLWYLSLKMDNGWTCEYFHILPRNDLRSVGATARVTISEPLGEVTKEPMYDAHLDIRCYNPSFVTGADAKNVFGREHVAQSTVMPIDTTYVATDSSNRRAYVDTYCLFSPEIQSEIRVRSGLSGFTYRTGNSPEDKLTETCNAYGDLPGSAQSLDAGSSLVDSIIARTLEHEGVCPRDEEGNCRIATADRGGATKYGITLDTLRSVRGPDTTQEDVFALSQEQAFQIYKDRYYYQNKIDTFPTAIQPILFDMTVNHGPGNAFYILQQGLIDNLNMENVPDSEAPDDATRRAVELAFEQHEPTTVINAIVDRRLTFYNGIIARDPTQARFLNGWTTRAESYRSDEVFNSFSIARVRDSIGSYTFDQEFSVEIDPQITSSRQRRQTLLSQLSDCAIDDTACIQSALRLAPSEVTSCQEYPEQLQSAASRCSSPSSTQCGCLIPLPQTGSLVIEGRRGTIVSDDGTQDILLDWMGVGEDWDGIVGMRIKDMDVAGQRIIFTADTLRLQQEAEGGFADVQLAYLDSPYIVATIRSDLSSAEGLRAFVEFSADTEQLCEDVVPTSFCPVNQDPFFVDLKPPSVTLDTGEPGITAPQSDLGESTSFAEFAS